jgi:hypothetical protein
METLLLVAGAALGLIVPFLFTHVLTQGIERSPFLPATSASARIEQATQEGCE